MTDLTPARIVAELDRHIVGQAAAKRAVAIALRSRWRRQQLPEDMRKDVTPKNILMIGPTGVGKTEIARRLAQLTGAPFLKVEATKYTEVGYHGRDVESIIRDLTEIAAGMVRTRLRDEVRAKAAERVTERLLDLLIPTPRGWEPEDAADTERKARTREKLKAKLVAGEMEERTVEVPVEVRGPGGPVAMMAAPGLEGNADIQEMMERLMPKSTRNRPMTVREARAVLLEQEADALIDRAAVGEESVALAENSGIVFLDEIDKVCGPQAGQGPDVSRQGVQRDLLPIIEGTTVNTRQGPVRTDHILFIAAGAFHVSKPSDLMPELQGRLPIRVELSDLSKDDFLRILTEPQHALTRQYVALMATDGVALEFTPDALDAMAEIAFEVNRSTQNIGARRLHTILERVVEKVSFEGPDRAEKRAVIDAAYVREKLGHIAAKEDLSRFIL